jgi:hypothetical protein
VALVIALGGCSSPEATPSPTDARSGGLPGPFDLLPPGARGAVAWVPATALAESFDARVPYDSPQAVADAYGASLLEAYAPGPDRPRLTLEPAMETDARVILIISETGFGDDSVAGNQHALVMVRGVDEWYITSIWSRILCGSGVHPTGARCA